jgi:hypothetical protein
MAELEVTCPKCGKQYWVDESDIGLMADCEACGAEFEVARSEPTPPADAEPAEPLATLPAQAPNPEAPGVTMAAPAPRSDGDLRDAEAAVGGSYEIISKLGEGTFGAVYRVHHKGWNVDMAVKSARPDANIDAEDVTRAVEVWMELTPHPNIVSCYFVRKLGGRAAEVLDYGPEAGMTTGASGDLEHATHLARQMICRYGMDEKFGLLATPELLRHAEAVGSPAYQEVSKAAGRILKTEMEETQNLLETHREQLDAVSVALLRENRLYRKDLEALLGTVSQAPAQTFKLRRAYRRAWGRDRVN